MTVPNMTSKESLEMDGPAEPKEISPASFGYIFLEFEHSKLDKIL